MITSADWQTAALQRWLEDEALPFWAQVGPDWERGGYVEDLTLTGADAARPFKRTRVTCRQMYVFAHATALGWGDYSREIAHGAAYLTEQCWQGPERGFARLTTRDGAVHDPTTDLYDHAFALFASAWAFRATGDSSYRFWAARSLETIERLLDDPHGPGYLHVLPAPDQRLQNPHMHLFEACLAAHGAIGAPVYRAVGMRLWQLLTAHVIDPKTGILGEVFDAQWRPAAGQAGTVVEPGHHYEWAWILQRAEAQWGLPTAGTVRSLIAFAEAHGFDGATGQVRNGVTRSGAVIDGASRTWPNTERLKAAVALHALGEKSRSERMIGESARVLLQSYLTPCDSHPVPLGAWIDVRDARGQPAAQHIPASTFYHLFMAIAEVLRVRPVAPVTWQPDRNVRAHTMAEPVLHP
ncbi:MAG: AGE family epimerase/isomerase [Pseudomonadota bacterium]